MIGRTVSAASASSRLLLLGCYDESLVLTRGVGELANLLFLFALDKAAHDRWEEQEPKKRWEAFSPAKVRKRLADRGAPVLIDVEVYGPASQLVHGTRKAGSQAYNVFQMPGRAEFQEAGSWSHSTNWAEQWPASASQCTV